MGGQGRCGRSRVKGQASVNGVEGVKVEVEVRGEGRRESFK